MTGTNPQGNHYCNRDYGFGAPNSVGFGVGWYYAGIHCSRVYCFIVLLFHCSVS